MYQWIAGIGLDENAPGFKNVLIRPQPIQEIAWVEAYHDSPHGRIFVDWKKLNGEFYLNIDIPANSSATVFVPASSSEKVSEGGRPIDQNREISLLRHDGGISVYAIGSGRYRFRSS
jgi:alpha-L-rhamnosidase